LSGQEGLLKGGQREVRVCKTTRFKQHFT